jgi:hypothetical protein
VVSESARPHAATLHIGSHRASRISAAAIDRTVAVVVNRGQLVIVVGRIDVDRSSQLLTIAQASGLLRRSLGLGKYRKQNSGKDGDDCDDDQKFN